jgi:hypothetical protein
MTRSVVVGRILLWFLLLSFLFFSYDYTYLGGEGKEVKAAEGEEGSIVHCSSYLIFPSLIDNGRKRE